MDGSVGDSFSLDPRSIGSLGRRSFACPHRRPPFNNLQDFAEAVEDKTGVGHSIVNNRVIISSPGGTGLVESPPTQETSHQSRVLMDQAIRLAESHDGNNLLQPKPMKPTSRH